MDLTPYPFKKYKNAWLSFRNITNETSETAKWLVEYSSISGKKSIADIGCGDGQLLKLILEISNTKPERILLIEIENSLLLEAKKNLGNKATEIFYHHRNLTEFKIENLNKYEAILASHVFYLVPESYLIDILKKLSKQTTLYVLIDETDSLFGSFWKLTSPLHYSRLKNIHSIICNLSKEEFEVKQTQIRCQIKDPFLLPEKETTDVLSLLCYSDMKDKFREDPMFFHSVMSPFKSSEGYFSYNCSCYQILKTK